MPDVSELLRHLDALTPLSVGLVVLAGLIVGIAPSSFALLSVAAGLAAGQANAGGNRTQGLWLSAGFALGIATSDAVIGALFGLTGFAVMRVLASMLGLAYGVLSALLVVIALALLRVIPVRLPVLVPSREPGGNFFKTYLVGLPFGLSTCPACTPLILPVVAAAAATADPLMGAVLMLMFGIARGVPMIIAGTLAGKLFRAKDTRGFVRWAERIGAALMLGAAVYFVYRAAVYSGWMSG